MLISDDDSSVVVGTVSDRPTISRWVKNKFGEYVCATSVLLKSPILSMQYATSEEGFDYGTIWAGCADGSLLKVDKHGDIVQKFFVSGAGIRALAVTPSAIFVGAANGDVAKVNPASGSKTPVLPSHSDAVVSIGARDGVLVTGSRDGTLIVWSTKDPAMPKPQYTMKGMKVWLGNVEVDETRIVTDGADNQVLVHDFSL